MRNKFLSDFISFWKKKSRSNLVRILAQSENNSLEKMLCSRHRILPNPHCCCFFFSNISPYVNKWATMNPRWPLLWPPDLGKKVARKRFQSASVLIFEYDISKFLKSELELLHYVICWNIRWILWLIHSLRWRQRYVFSFAKRTKNVWFNYDFTIFLEDHINFSQKLQPVFRYNM